MTLEELQNTIKIEVGVLLYFSGENCNVCHALRPKFKELFDTEFPALKVSSFKTDLFGCT